MKGIVRGLDHLGRITTPMEYRRSFGIQPQERAPIGMRVDGLTIRLSLNQVGYKGIVRDIDEQGRVTLPIELRRSLKFDELELVDMWVEDDEVCIRKASLQCVICEETDEGQLMDIDDVLICRKCGNKIVDKFMEE